MSDRLRFGIFLPPMNLPGQNPTVSLERNLELLQHLDRLGFDEAWVGEHHSAGYEIIASPEVFIATAAERTRHIRLGTGVSSVPYHHPLQLADRMVLLDHLTRGRAMFGVGPGQLTSDAWMLGIDPSHQRRMLDEGLDAILALMRGEVVTRETDWFTLRDARLQVAPYTSPHMEMAVAGSISPSGPRLAGRHGLGMLSLASWHPAGFAELGGHWDIYADESARAGHEPRRDTWRNVGIVFLGETDAQARRALQYGFLQVVDYLAHIIPVPAVQATDFDGVIDELNANGSAAIGTPDRAVDYLQRLQDKTGGMGAFLMLAADFADREDTLRSYELFARHVAPHFQGQLGALERSRAWVMGAAEGESTRWVNATADAIRQTQAEYAKEREQLGAVAD